MGTYEVEFFETIRHVITVKADNEEQAELFAEEFYLKDNKTSFILNHYGVVTENSIGLTVEVQK